MHDHGPSWGWSGVHVVTNESFAGAPVEADPDTMRAMLDRSLQATRFEIEFGR
ncbi:hypothetical protein Psi02_32420 [Planotetraspora silvatica]|uniref:Uncharacterized protein n=1 Tax=Planotetraspora silvatica TaxID=234614 RepID=A0A8J3XS27_9ACTN|nr:hypothetical protein [Planotetraspora silvatica]GII46818.1 hypothetical protein Psi02_32420 [Planotetraspora silvatica]